jgi:streptogramin lyase
MPWLASGLLLQAAFGAAQTVTEFLLPPPEEKNLEEITAGPDGNLWFTEVDGNRIGKITPSGVITEFPLPHADSVPHGIAAGPDGNLWFAEERGNRIGRISTAGEIVEFALPQSNSGPHTITAGPDGNLWFTEENGNRIGRITPDGIVSVFSVPTSGSSPKGIAAGPDGAVWFVETVAHKIGRITTAGAITEFGLPNGSQPLRIAAGPDGNLWFTEFGTNKIGRITPAGAVTHFAIPTPGAGASGITAGPDGAMWFTEGDHHRVGRVTPAGVITEINLAVDAEPDGIVTGRDRNVWFLEGGLDRQMIARVNIPNACGDPDGALCLSGGRFQVTTTWRKTNGDTGTGHAIGLTDDSGYFWFFNSSNIELVVKTLNACGINQHFWVFGGGLTNVQVHMTVRDTVTGDVQEYDNLQSTPFAPIQDTSAFAACSPSSPTAGARPELTVIWPVENAEAVAPDWEVLASVETPAAAQVSSCVPSSTAMCLNGRFKVEATWRKTNGDTGPGRVVQLTPDSGYIWFFSPNNIELITKVLNACSFSAHQWVFAGGLTNVRVDLTVTDTLTGAVKPYVNPLSTPFQPIQDTSAFSTCP